MQQEYSQPPILPSPHFRWVVNDCFACDFPQCRGLQEGFIRNCTSCNMWLSLYCPDCLLMMRIILALCCQSNHLKGHEILRTMVTNMNIGQDIKGSQVKYSVIETCVVSHRNNFEHPSRRKSLVNYLQRVCRAFCTYGPYFGSQKEIGM